MAGPGTSTTSTTSSPSLPTSSPDSRMMERLVLWRREEGRREGGREGVEEARGGVITMPGPRL